MALNKITIERNQRTLLDLVAQPGNDVCADCKVRNPRWASHSLGIFICVSCASIHRKIGTHVSKVKSLTMDSWTREQTENMRENGNIKSNHYYNPNEARHPPPPNLMDGERDSEMEQFIRSKYEYKSFIDKSALVASKLGPSRSAASVAQRPSPSPSNSTPQSSKTPSTSTPPAAPVRAATVPAPKATPTRSLSQPLPAAPALPQQSQFQQPRPQIQQPPQQAGGVWNDLISLQTPASSSSFPLQFQAPSAPLQGYGQQQPMMNTGYQPQMTPSGMGMSANPYQSQFAPSNSYPSQMQPQFTPSYSSPSFGGGGAPSYNPQPQPFAPPQQQQQLFQGQPIHSPLAQGPSPGQQGFGFQQPGQSMTPTFGNQMLNPHQFGTPSPQPFMSGSPQPQQQFQPQAGQFMGSSPQPPFQQFNGGMQQGQQWMGGPHMGYGPQQPQQQQQQGWGGM
ncbi:hypothetical protein B0H11DRAFT_2271669 [Mycena galericulata]|nr:hypothetical protein B0H11DRAFT_2271669 [Mycena galericulata]